MEEQETHSNAPPRPIYVYFQHGKQALTRKHFLNKVLVENLFMLSDIIITQLKQEPT